MDELQVKLTITTDYGFTAYFLRELANQIEEEGERLLTFTNNSGPLFILGTIGITLFGDTSIGLLLLITHLLSCFTVALIFRFWKIKNRNESIDNLNIYSDVISFKDLGKILSTSIVNSIRSIELTSGVSLIATIPSVNLGINVVFTAFILGFGGVSILLQVWSIISNSDISIKPYILGKLLQGLFASIYTFLIISNFSYFKYLLL